MKRSVSGAMASVVVLVSVGATVGVAASPARAATVASVCTGQDAMVHKTVTISSTAFTLTYIDTFSIPPRGTTTIEKSIDRVATLTAGTTTSGEASAGVTWPIVQASAKLGYSLSRTGQTSTAKSMRVSTTIVAHKRPLNEVFFNGYNKVTGTWSAYDCSRAPHHGRFVTGTFRSWSGVTHHEGAAQCGLTYPTYDKWDRAAQRFGCH